MRFLNASTVSFSAWQSITLTSCPACSATAPRYAMPSGMNGGCEWAFSGYGGFTSVTFTFLAPIFDCLDVKTPYNVYDETAWYRFRLWIVAGTVFG